MPLSEKLVLRIAPRWGNRPREEQLGLRVYNLEQEYGVNEVVERLRWVCSNSHGEGALTFDDEFWMPYKHDKRDMVYVQVVQIVRCYDKDLVLRFLSFNYKNELEKAV